MSNEYNSILKEKKVYVDKPVTYEHSMLKRFILLGLFFVLVLIIIGYLVYYNSVLSGESILLNNTLKIIDKYGVMLEGINFNYDLSNNHMLSGSISVDDFKYDYSFIKDKNTVKRTISGNNHDIVYYYDSDSSYVKSSVLGDSYISFNNNLYTVDEYKKSYKELKNGLYNYFSSILTNDSSLHLFNRLYNIENYDDMRNNITNNFSNYINDSMYKKKLYFNNGRPVVNINLKLTTEDINKIMGNGDNNIIFKDNLSFAITTENDAILNVIKNIKIVVVNNTNNSRFVIRYDGDDLVYTSDAGDKYRYNISGNSGKRTLKIYKNDELYCVLELNKNKNKYIYNYQYIDKLMRYGLEVDNNKDKYSYRFSANINNNINSVVIEGKYYNDGAIDEDIKQVVNYRDLNDSDRKILNRSIKEFFSK